MSQHIKKLASSIPLNLSTKQFEKLKQHCTKTGVIFSEERAAQAYKFWIENLCISTHYERDLKPMNQARTIRHVLIEKAPNLLFVDLDGMSERLEKFRQLGFINNIDKFYVFHKAPYGWYLQNWEQFSTKFNYIQYRIMPWLVFKQDDQYPTPHPLIKTCEALELPYEHIKSRFLWVKSAGIAPQKLNEKGGDKLNYWKILQNLLLTKNAYFVKTTTPGAKLIEYEFFEKFIAHHELVEDSIMSRLSELTSHERTEILENHEDEEVREIAKVEHRKIM